MASLAIRLEKERLEKDLAARKTDYEGVADKLRWETNPIEQNSLQAKLNQLSNNIKRLEQELETLKNSSQADSQAEIIKILQPYFDQENIQIQKAYRLSLPERLIDKELPSSLEALISSLQLPQQEENYTFMENFVGNILLDKNVPNELIRELNSWARKNINKYLELRIKLKEEQQQREQQCSPGLLVAISKQQGGYVVEAWLVKNITQYKQYSPSDFEQLTINQQSVIPTNKELNNVPAFLRHWINEGLDKCDQDIKQIHIFLPYKLMNNAVDCWQTYEDEDETIGEFYEVIVRCSERLRGKNPRVMRWRNKGRIFRELAQPAADIFTLCDSSNDKILESDCKKDDVIAVKITTFFKQEQPGTVLWKSGIPLALWIRQQLPYFDNKLVLDKLISDCFPENNCYFKKDPIPVKDIPERVKEKRLESIKHKPPESHIGRHLCLLWDDPNLLPPEPLLTPNKL